MLDPTSTGEPDPGLRFRTVGLMRSKTRWHDLSPAQRKAVVAGALVELVATSWAVQDLRSRPAQAVRGPKSLWGASFVVQPFGPLAYLAFGRR